MVVVFAEEGSVEKHITSLFGKHKWQAGLIIGAVTEKRHLAVSLIPTPPEDVENPGTFLTLDKDWVKMHAEQVRQSLPGGLDIIGSYLFSSSKVDYATKLRQMTYSVACSSESASSCPRGAVAPADARPAPAVDTNAETAQFGEADTQERLALHVCADTKKRTCRTFHVGDPKASPRPAEWKDKAFVHQWQTVRCGIDVSAIVNLPMARTDTPQLEAEVQQALQSEYTRIAAGAVAWADAEHVSLPASQLPDDAVCECTMYMPVGPPEGGSAPKSTTATVNTTLELSGSLSAVAVVPPASTRGAGERALKADIVRSLQARCLSTCRGWDEDRSEDIAAGPVQRQIARLPLRVSAPLIGPILLSDYVDSDTGPEGLGEAVERFQEIFGITVDQASLQQDEKFEEGETTDDGLRMAGAVAPATPSTKRVAGPSSAVKATEQAGDSNSSMLVALTVLVVAIVVGFMLMKS